MTFHWPHAFWLLLVPLFLGAMEFRRRQVNSQRTHPKIIRAEAGPAQLSFTPETTAKTLGSRLRWRLLTGLILAVIALARPQWGLLDEPVFDQSREIIIALDLSRSMLSDDVRPSRLDRAKLLVSSLLEQLHGERVGLVVFSGTAFLQSPLSADYEILRDFLPGLNTKYLPEGGTNYAALLSTSLNAFGTSGSADRFLVILSDGEATDDDWKPHAAELKAKGIRVIGLGVGTAAGTMIPDGTGSFVKDERGAVVLSKLESATLQQLASETNGLYADASSWVDIAQLLESTVSKGQRGTFVERSRVRLAEHFQWALGPALLFFFWSFWWELPVRPRLRDVKLAPPAPPPLPEMPADSTHVSSPANLKSVAGLLVATGVFSLLALRGTLDVRADEKETAPAESLAKLVTTLSQRSDLAAQDYADFAHATISYGQKLQSTQKHVPAGPIHDGLAAVDLGETLNPKTADWPALRRDLEALLKKKEQPPQQQQQQQQSQQQQKKEDQQKQENQQQQQQQQKQQNSETKPQQEKQQEQQQQQQNQPGQKPPPDKQSTGDMKDKSSEQTDKPPQPSDPTEQQKVGGATEKKDAAESKDPALKLPLQKLEQLKDQDSPTKLYQLMQGQTSAPKKPAKDW